MIETHVDTDLGVTTAVCSGSMAVADITDWVRESYAGDPTRFILWDFGEADVSAFSPTEMQSLVGCLAAFDDHRSGGRTAIVAGVELSFGIGRMYEAYAEIANRSVPIRVFRSRKDAMTWLLDGEEQTRA